MEHGPPSKKLIQARFIWEQNNATQLTFLSVFIASSESLPSISERRACTIIKNDIKHGILLEI